MDPASASTPAAGAFSCAPRLVRYLPGLAAAALLGWLVVRGWQQPGLMLDIANLRLC